MGTLSLFCLVRIRSLETAMRVGKMRKFIDCFQAITVFTGHQITKIAIQKRVQQVRVNIILDAPPPKKQRKGDPKTQRLQSSAS